LQTPNAGERPAIIAPPESEWYHGRLDRYSAESRLRGSSKLGSYLGVYKMVFEGEKVLLNKYLCVLFLMLSSSRK